MDPEQTFQLSKSTQFADTNQLRIGVSESLDARIQFFATACQTY